MTALVWRCFGCSARARFAVRLGTQQEPKRACGRHLTAAVDEVCANRDSTYVHVEQVQR